MSASLSPTAHDSRPPLLQDRAFWGLNLTQFLGAFNDNLFKQLVMLMCLDQASQGGRDLQGIGMILFAAPFILFSGYAGFLSDRYSKRTIIVLCKIAEVLIVALGMIGFITGSLTFLLAVLCLMGVHSAFFGPSKYGILPEMLRKEDLPRANGMILMATFLAIIFGLSAAGAAKEQWSHTLWLASLPCLLTALVGLGSSLTLRPTPIAQPSLRFDYSSVAIAPDTMRLLRKDRQLLLVLLMSSVFWFVGGTVYPPAINAFCKEQFGFGDGMTGQFAASTGVGIAIGCIAAGVLSKNRVRGWMIRMGAWGITLSLLVLALPGPGWEAAREQIKLKKLALKNPPVVQANDTSATPKNPSTNDATAAATDEVAANDKTIATVADPKPLDPQVQFYRGTFLGPYWSAAALVSLGLFAGFFSVPLLVFLQSKAPIEQKGRIIGANNLLNWFGIAGSGAVYQVGRITFVDWLMLPQATLFGFAALLMLPVALFFRPPNAEVEQQATPLNEAA